MRIVIPGFVLTTFCKNGKTGISVFVAFSDRVLGHFQKVSKAVQKSEILLDICAELYSSLVNFLSKIREDFNVFGLEAKAILPNINYRAVLPNITPDCCIAWIRCWQ